MKKLSSVETATTTRRQGKRSSESSITSGVPIGSPLGRTMRSRRARGPLTRAARRPLRERKSHAATAATANTASRARQAVEKTAANPSDRNHSQSTRTPLDDASTTRRAMGSAARISGMVTRFIWLRSPARRESDAAPDWTYWLSASMRRTCSCTTSGGHRYTKRRQSAISRTTSSTCPMTGRKSGMRSIGDST